MPPLLRFRRSFSGSPVRDSQRAKLYTAERVLHLPHDRRGPDSTLREIAQCQAYVDRITQSAWYGRTFPHARRNILVAHGGGRSAARACGSGRIELPGWARQRAVILHELAHCVVERECATVAWHGREFAAIYLKLVQHGMGRAAAAKLKTSYAQYGVKWRAKRRLSPEAREAATRILRAARAAIATPDRRHDLALARANQA